MAESSEFEPPLAHPFDDGCAGELVAGVLDPQLLVTNDTLGTLSCVAALSVESGPSRYWLVGGTGQPYNDT